MERHRLRLILIVAANLIWLGVILWMVVFRNAPSTHSRLFAALAIVLIPIAIGSSFFARKRMPWLALSLNLLIAASILLGIRLVCEEFLKIEHSAMDWLAWGGRIFLWLSMLTGILTSVRKLREKGSGETRA